MADAARQLPPDVGCGDVDELAAMVELFRVLLRWDEDAKTRLDEVRTDAPGTAKG